MNSASPHAFAAELLERSAAGFAGYSASLLLERQPGMRERYAPDPLGAWKIHLNQRILELSAALAVGEARLFSTRVLWTARAFGARGQAVADVPASLEALRDILAERLPEAARATPLAYLEQAIAGLSRPAQVGGELDPGRPNNRLALQYLQKVLEGDVANAIRSVVAAVDAGLGTRAAYLEVLLPAQREIGRLWHLGEVSVAEEHLVTSTTQRVMSILAYAAKAAPPNGHTAVVAAVASNAHDVGLRAVADLYQFEGWKTIFLGADVPVEDLPSVLAYFAADLLLVGATLSTHITRVQQTVATIRSKCERPVKVLVGGAAFDEVPELWRQVGADGYAPTVADALVLGRELVTSRVGPARVP
jgi:MerR family transcriptional regulator, light-induced transcriptional regulator